MSVQVGLSPLAMKRKEKTFHFGRTTPSPATIHVEKGLPTSCFFEWDN